MISQDLLEILRCPYCVSHQTRQPGEDPGRLTLYKDTWLVDETCGRKYPIRDDIPVMLIDEAETVDDAEHDRLVAKAQAEGVPSTLSEG